MRYLGIALSCLAILAGVFCDEDIHKYMSSDEVQRIFHTDTDTVPNYEIVEIHLSERLHKRDLLPTGSKMHIKAFGEDINLWLHPTDSILAGDETPVYYARESPFKAEPVQFWRRSGLLAMIGQIYEDPRRMASMVIGTEESGLTRINGFIDSKSLAVRSLPTRVAEEYRRRRRSIVDSDQTNSSYHVVFQVPKTFQGDYKIPPLDKAKFLHEISGFSDEIPDTIYPEVLVVLDYGMYRAYRGDIYSLLEYLLAFWNGVDLKYRSLESPKVKFHISGIVLPEDPYALTYMSRNAITFDTFDSEAAMNDCARYFYNVRDTFPSDSYDFAVTMTRQVFGIDKEAGVLGKAWVGAACSFHESIQSNHGVALIQDNGAFFGVFVAAHEIGHLLGSHHDETKEGCSYTHGFIMAYTPSYTLNSSDFSKCSIAAIDDHLKSSRLDCLFNRPVMKGEPLPKIMPGRMADLNTQCRVMSLGPPCETEIHNICVKLHCLDARGVCVDSGSYALDGSICENNPKKFCLHQRCVSLQRPSVTITTG